MSSDTQDVYVYLAAEAVHTTKGVDIGINVDLAANGDVVGVECLSARSVTIDGRLVAAPSLVVDRKTLADFLRDARDFYSDDMWHLELADRLISAGWVRGPVEQQGDRTISIQHLVEAELAIARLTMDSAGQPVRHNTAEVAHAVAYAFELEIVEDPTDDAIAGPVEQPNRDEVASTLRDASDTHKTASGLTWSQHMAVALLARYDIREQGETQSTEQQDGAGLIAAERHRVVTVEGYNELHDDMHISGELAAAGAAYALAWPDYDSPGDVWPWAATSWKPTPDDRIRELVKAGQFIAAEIDRLQRAERGEQQ